MAKGQMRSSREAKKPKKGAVAQAKAKPATGPVAPPPMPVTIKQKNS